ncbi:N-acetylmuramic acid 6-phosphate etherase [Reichenbachiella carrageenanivorans]|uniref:N-acetylmuramic acid 6-phosphate etherase n=1 Tax=Reichenbachiella carrageenanivorans TaxID=2979869 RepID=A0ABY6CYP9_9BACT|nr:N-acetylmuramic acid 6-phosphate etherase [Reichenbachiella carrageenanivorans]UXX79045.1 N-acetylmuramic acid 6-phosphate etherase [Reichenbachiella carrageenanivorans]
MKNTTESPSNYTDLQHMSVTDLLTNMNKEDQTVPMAVEKVIPSIEALVQQIVAKMSKGGRLFYIGAGTSGRLGVVDASEIPPTYGLPQGKVVGVIAGGDGAIRKSVEHAEDDPKQAWRDVQAFGISDKDVLIGIAASGRTPYVIGGLAQANAAGLVTGCITCNTGSEMAATAQYPIEVVVGPEFVTGSTRMKAGTAQKLVLNMISTATMIRLGHVQGNKMVDMQLSNEKLVDRAIRMVMEETGISRTKAELLVKSQGSVRKAIDHYNAEDA